MTVLDPVGPGADLAGFESFRTTVWGSDAMRALGAQHFPALASGDLTVLPEEVPEFLRECVVVAANIERIVPRQDPNHSHEWFVETISVRLAKHPGCGRAGLGRWWRDSHLVARCQPCWGCCESVGAYGAVDGYRQRADTAYVLDRMRKDPSLRFTESGRAVLRWLEVPFGSGADLETIVDKIPSHCAPGLAEIARQRSRDWEQLAELLDHRT